MIHHERAPNAHTVINNMHVAYNGGRSYIWRAYSVPPFVLVCILLVSGKSAMGQSEKLSPGERAVTPTAFVSTRPPIGAMRMRIRQLSPLFVKLTLV